MEMKNFRERLRGGSNIRLLIVAAMACAGAVPMNAAQADRLSAYKAQIAYADERHAAVRASFTVAQNSRSNQPVRIIVYPGQTIQGLKVQAVDVHASEEPNAGGMLVPIPPPHNVDAESYTIEYQVTATSRLRHVPLPVPLAVPSMRESAVKLETELPEGTALLYDAFPKETWNDVRHGATQLSAVPSVLTLQFRPNGKAVWFERWTTVGQLSTVVMMLIIGLGLVLLYWFKRGRSYGQKEHSA